MKKILSISFILLFLLFSCKSNNIALRISKKVKGNYYLDYREILIEKIDTTKNFVLYENIYTPNADYKGCVLQKNKIFCISGKIKNIKNYKIIDKTIEDIEISNVFFDEDIINYIKNKNIDNLKIIDSKIQDNHSYSQVIYYENGIIKIYKFNSSLMYNPLMEEEW